MAWLVGALEMVNLTPGKDFQIVIVSIDPSEGPALAAAKKAIYVKRYGKVEHRTRLALPDRSDQPAIKALAEAVGFGYVRLPQPEGKPPLFAHASFNRGGYTRGPDGAVLHGRRVFAQGSPSWDLVEASHNTIGTPVDNILTYCYRYDPKLNRHSLVGCPDRAGRLPAYFSVWAASWW